MDVANAVSRGDEIEHTGRRVAYRGAEYDVAWCAMSGTPAVGYFPGSAGARENPSVQAAIQVLKNAGLTPVVFGEPVGERAFNVERDGFTVGLGETSRRAGGEVLLCAIGRTGVEQHPRAVETLREAGWTVSSARRDDGAHYALPPA